MMMRSHLLALLLATSVAPLLGACGDDDDGGTTADAAPHTADAEPGTIDATPGTIDAASSADAAPVACAANNTTFAVTNTGTASYNFDGNANATLRLCRGNTYTFAMNAAGHPFYIKTTASTGTGNAYNDGVTNNGAATGNIVFVVPAGAPATLHYNCQFHGAMTGTLLIQAQ